MAITITLDPTGPVAKKSACRVDVAGASPNTVTGYDATKYPASPEVRCYLAFLLGGAMLGKSYPFTVSQAGKHSLNTYVFPSAGNWTVELRKVSDDSVLATKAVTVS